MRVLLSIALFAALASLAMQIAGFPHRDIAPVQVSLPPMQVTVQSAVPKIEVQPAAPMIEIKPAEMPAITVAAAAVTVTAPVTVKPHFDLWCPW